MTKCKRIIIWYLNKRTETMSNLDSSQLEFCRSTAKNIRLLAPAGCGKTSSLLYRCSELVRKARTKPRFLIVTFTVAAANELQERLRNDTEFASVQGQANITTLNAYGWQRIRSQVSSPQLLSDNTKRYFAMRNQLRPAWVDNPQISSIVTKRGGNGARILMTVMDNLKSMGFDHTQDTNLSLFNNRLTALESQGLSWRIEEQFDLLTDIGVLEAGKSESASTNKRQFYDRFFKFWMKATDSLLDQSTFTFEDQKYWTYLDLKSPGLDGKRKPYFQGIVRYDHILVDEFQDINPLDMELIKVLAERNRATITIVGDDDQAIFEWRGATPEYILHPEQYFGVDFQDYQLAVNYRSPKNIVECSQRLISKNENRVAKKVSASESAEIADITIEPTGDINEQLERVTEIVRSTEPGKVAVIGRFRSQLIPFQIYFAHEGAPFKTAADLDVFSSKAFDDLVNILENWSGSQERRSSVRAVEGAIGICNLIKRFPFSKKDNDNLGRYLRKENPRSTAQAISDIENYDGEGLSGRSHKELHEIASAFVESGEVSEAIRVVDEKFAGLRFDREKAEDDVFFTAPPLEQLAQISELNDLGADDLINRIETAQNQIRDYQAFDDSSDSEETGENWERPLHLMTATRAKGKEFDTIVLLDTVEGVWPHNKATDQRELEAERRLFYVAFTRARKKVIMLTGKEAGPISRFVEELGVG